MVRGDEPSAAGQGVVPVSVAPGGTVGGVTPVDGSEVAVEEGAAVDGLAVVVELLRLRAPMTAATMARMTTMPTAPATSRRWRSWRWRRAWAVAAARRRASARWRRGLGDIRAEDSGDSGDGQGAR